MQARLPGHDRPAASPCPGAPAPSRVAARLWSGACLLLLLALLASASAGESGAPWAAFETPWFDSIGLDEGLPDATTTALAQDRQGLLWIGTKSGLVRYDGYRMQVFNPSPRHDSGLRDSYVRALLTLPDGGVLIGTNAGGLSRFDPADNTLRAYPIDGTGTQDGKINALAADGDRGTWIASDQGLDYLDLRSDSITHVDTGVGSGPRNFSILTDRAGNVWLGNANGLFVRPAGKDAFVRASDDGGNPDITTVLHDSIWAIHEDDAGRLWVGSVHTGAVYRDGDGRWRAIPGFSGYHGQARPSTVRDFQQVGAAMWIATDGSGILTYTIGQDRTGQLHHDNTRSSSLPGDRVRAMLRDRSGNVWAATEAGLARCDVLAPRSAFSVLPSSEPGRGLSSNNVLRIFVDSRQRIWLGMDAGNIDVIDLHAGTLRALRLQGSQARSSALSFAETADGTIWVGAQGLARIDPDTLAVTGSAVPELDSYRALSMLAEGDTIAVATYEGVFRYDTRSHALAQFRHDPRDPTSLPSDGVRNIQRVGGNIWYITLDGISIARSPTQSDGFENLAHVMGDASSLPQNSVSAMALDRRGRAWVGTYGGLGLIEHYSDEGPYRFRALTTAQGLPGDKIYGVLIDDGGDTWISLSTGLARIDGDSLDVQPLGLRDGLRIPSYVSLSAARGPNGELLFGGLGGLTVIRPDMAGRAEQAAPLAVTQAVLDNNPVPYARLPQDGEPLELKRSRSLRADFALLDFRPHAATSYAYRMAGFDEDWTEIPPGSLPTAIYTNLPHGSYTLELRADTHGMHPLTVRTSIPVNVAPRWYETLLARLAAMLLAAMAIYLLIQLRTRYLRHQAAQLQRQIDAHTSELRIANARLDLLASTDDLTGIHNRRRFMELAEQVCAQASGQDACIALFDLDHFKRVNDEHGHMAGDAVLRAATATMRRQCRAHDLLGRYGGEEIVLCMPRTGLADANVVCERIRGALAAMRVEFAGQGIAITASAGIARLHDGESLNAWLSRADTALYQAKNGGRNRCVAVD